MGEREWKKGLPVVGRGVSDTLKVGLSKRESADLVFAVTGHIGSGASYVASALAETSRGHAFTTHSIRLSELLAEQRGLEAGKRTADSCSELQDAGDGLRREHGTGFVAGLGIRRVRALREAQSDPGRVFILDSIKHPSEVEVLRKVYGSSFYLIGVVCGEDTRRQRLRLKFKGENDPEVIGAIMDRDRRGDVKHGQQVGKTLELSDFFVANREDTKPAVLGDSLARFLNAVTGSEIVRPTRDEQGMQVAWAASLRSACLSRQVGAAILGPRGDVVASGANDPPRPGGGLYSEGSEPDKRCFNWERRCRNDQKKQEIYEAIYARLDQLELLARGTSKADLEAALLQTPVRDLIEFSRAVHAEMDAILSVARSGQALPSGSTLYCTTYPCHSCARHIVAAGLSRVVYIEPYEKSLAIELHADAIRDASVAEVGLEPGQDKQDERVVFELFSGVAPRRYAALFEGRQNLKDDAGHAVPPADMPVHVDPVLTGSYLDLENLVAESVTSRLEKSSSDA